MKLTMKTGSQLIAEERERQITAEGWTPEHDDKHEGGELACAAICYAMPNDLVRRVTKECHARGADGRIAKRLQSLFEYFWPWERQWWKPSPENRIRELVKAGALIAAEIDRLQRLR